MAGKQYLLDLFAAGFPVIPTVDRQEDLGRLPVVDTYVVKPKAGADSVGPAFLTRAEVEGLTQDGSLLVQPRIEFAYEVSFYVVDRAFQYALSAPAPDQR